MTHRALINYPGYVIRDSTIAVDFWPRNDKIKITHHFLTHAHSDHTKGLDSSWTHGMIFCTKITKNLIKELLHIPEIYISVLDTGRSYRFKINEENFFQVELIDANHCPGAVMYLFNGYFGTILSTGDFRYDPTMFIDSPLSPFKTEENSQVIDICYLDNTYCSKEYESIPTREKALLEIIKYIDLVRKNDEKFVLKYKKLGKETILVELAKRFKCKILVSNERFNRLTKVLELSEKYFTMNYDPSLFIEVEDSEKMFSSFLAKELALEKIYFIQPTGIFLNSNSSVSTRKQNSKINIYNVAYTDHSSYSELLEFIKNLKPKCVIATVKEIEENKCNLHVINDMKCFDQYLTRQPLVDGVNRYRLILQENIYLRSSDRSKPSNLNKNNKLFLSSRKTRQNMIKSINYEILSPVKTKPTTISTINNENWVKLNENVEILNEDIICNAQSLRIIENNEMEIENVNINDNYLEFQPVLVSNENNQNENEHITSISTVESDLISYTIDDYNESINDDENPRETVNNEDDDNYKENSNQNLNGIIFKTFESDNEPFVSAQLNNINHSDDSFNLFFTSCFRSSDPLEEEKKLDDLINRLLDL